MTITDELDDLIATFCGHGAGYDAEYINKSGYSDIGLVTLRVPSDSRCNNIGRNFMEQFTRILDEYGFGCKVMASEKFGGDLDRLIKFYQRFKFVPIQDEGEDIDGNREILLARPPNP